MKKKQAIHDSVCRRIRDHAAWAGQALTYLANFRMSSPSEKDMREGRRSLDELAAKRPNR